MLTPRRAFRQCGQHFKWQSASILRLLAGKNDLNVTLLVTGANGWRATDARSLPKSSIHQELNCAIEAIIQCVGVKQKQACQLRRYI